MEPLTSEAAGAQRAGHGKRSPTWLTVLCVLSLLHGVVNVFSGVRYAVSDAAEEDLAAATSRSEKMTEVVEARGQAPGTFSVDLVYPMNRIGRAYQMPLARPTGRLFAAFGCMSIVGVLLMWRKRAVGFLLYLVASAGELFALWRYQGTADPAGMLNVALGIAFAVLFAAAYAWILRRSH